MVHLPVANDVSGASAAAQLYGARYIACETRSSPHPSALFRPCLRPSERVPARSVRSKPPPTAAGDGLTRRNGPGRARTVSNRAETALTGAVRTGLESRRGWQ